jgi:SAM-dependent methyltransferase
MTFRRVDYDAVAPSYDRRYERSDYSGVARTLLDFVGDLQEGRVLEVGCGTGHWLSLLGDSQAQVAGTEPSAGMLARAKRAAPTAWVAQGLAEALPWSRSSFDRLFCVNAFHHFTGKEEFVHEAHRLLRPGGGLLTIGHDPHVGTHQWWVYDFFPEAIEIDKERYPPTEEIRAVMTRAGFEGCVTTVAQHFPREVPATQAMKGGTLDRNSTSQLTVLTDEEYNRGLERVEQAMASARSEGREMMLRAGLKLYATAGWIP